MTQRQKRLALYTLTPLLGVSMLGGVALAASTSTQATTTTTNTKGALSMPFGQRHGHGPKERKDLNALSTILGMTTAEIQTALSSGKTIDDLITSKGLSIASVHTQLEAAEEASMKTRLETEVASGRLTQAQADQMVAERATHEQTEKNQIASALGITAAELDTYQAAGTTIDQIITEKGLSKTTVTATLLASHQAEMKTKLESMVASGKLTQAQADTMITHMANHTMGGHHDEINDLD